MNEGLFGQDDVKVKKRKPGKVGAPKDGIITEIPFGKCGRTFPDGTVCDNPRLPGACHSAPAGKDGWAFVTPCRDCEEDIRPFIDIQPLWTQVTREDREPLYHFLVENWPLIINKAIKQGDPSCPKKKSKSP
jgi:hypothetical protein